MIEVRVRYFLNPQGIEYFPIWYRQVVKVTSQQEGFIELKIIGPEQALLIFENETKLDKWCETEAHELLVKDIEQYYIAEPKVEINL